MDQLTSDELLDLIVELEQYPSDEYAQAVADEALAELMARGEFTGPDYGGN